ncbi:MAG TPA: methyltransferase domain-containing protein [Acidobacteriota bacterium]|nr:methyltransferase domain-containing protein [Acidobacteriota bacterium]
MANGYLAVYERFPEFLKRRINPMEYALRDFVRQAAQSHPGETVLDAGAGESRFRSFFGRHRYWAFDLAVGEQDWDYSRLDACVDLSRLPLKSGSVGAVLNTQVLEHVPDPQAVISEFQRVLRPGGTLYLSAPQGWHEHQQPYDFFRFTQFSLRQMMERAGFQGVEIEPMGGYFHYLGQRFTYIPKILFQHRRGLPRVLLSPLELLSLGLFCFLVPVLCSYLDVLDRKKEFTLLYRCRASK